MDKRIVVIIGGLSAGAVSALLQYLHEHPDAVMIREGMAVDQDGNLQPELIKVIPDPLPCEILVNDCFPCLAHGSKDIHINCVLRLFSVENPGFFAIICVLKWCKTWRCAPTRGPPCG